MYAIKFFVMAKFQLVVLHHLTSLTHLKLKNHIQLDLTCLIIKCKTLAQLLYFFHNIF